MKRFFSILIAAALLVGCAAPAFAQSGCTCGHSPLLVISGMNSSPMILDEGTPNERVVFPPEEFDIPVIVNAAVKGLAAAAVRRDWGELADALIPVARDILEPVACNPDGTSKYNISVRKFENSMEYYPDMTEVESAGNEYGLAKRASDMLGKDHVYFYNYNWRMDPIDHAREINELIKKMKRETGHDKVTIAPCSMGGAQALAYMALYGFDDIDGCVSLSSVFFATQVASELFTKQIEFDKDSVIRYVSNMGTGNDFADKLISSLLTAVDRAGLARVLIDFVNGGVDEITDQLYDELLKDIFATMPGLWAVVDDDSYDLAKSIMLDSEKNAELIKKIDYYHENVALKREEILLAARAAGVKMVILATYNTQNIPAYPAAANQGDNTLETAYVSGGATCAPLEQTLPQDYVQKNTQCGHNHISPDRVIDASTCLFPEYTWFGKDWPHVMAGSKSGYCDFVMWLITFKGQPTVFTNPSYPQFFGRSGEQIMNLETGELVPLGFELPDADAGQAESPGPEPVLTPPTGVCTGAAGTALLLALLTGAAARKRRR